MNTESEQSSSHSPHHEELMAALFAQLVMQQANMAMMLLGKVAHPETGKAVKDLDAARLFIDELEMLETKTKGNLSKDESALLKQSLMNLRLAYVQAVEEPEQKPTASTPPSSPPTEAAPSTDSAGSPPSGSPGTAAADEEHRKKFSKKY
jgi:hypothetical protein